MKRKTLVYSIAAATLVVGVATFTAAPTFAHGWGGQMGHGYGHGMMGQGYGQGHGMMGKGQGNCQYGQQQLDKELSIDDVKQFVEQRLSRHGMERLKVGKVEASGDNIIVAEIVTVDDSLVHKIEFNTQTGAHRPVN